MESGKLKELEKALQKILQINAKVQTDQNHSNRSKSYATKNGYGICYPTQEGRNRQTDTLTKINISYRYIENLGLKKTLICV